MGFTARKSFKIAPGVRMTVTPRGVGVSAGVKGARVSVNSRGRVTQTVGIPGTGISHTTSRSIQSKASPQRSTQRAAASPATALTPAPKPGLLAPKWEKELYKVLFGGGNVGTLQALAGLHPEAQQTIALFDFLLAAMPAEDYVRARAILGWLHSSAYDPARDGFILRYASRATITLKVADGVTVMLPLDAAAIGLSLAELHQQAGDLDASISVVEGLEPTTIAAVSLAELYAERGRWRDVVELTDGLSNEDEASTFLLVQRGIAFREDGFFEAARESLKEALRVRSRSAELRHVAYVERGRTYLAEGKPAMARKDFERVMSENSMYPGLAELLA